jgi:hypothetical protein
MALRIGTNIEWQADCSVSIFISPTTSSSNKQVSYLEIAETVLTESIFRAAN